MHNNTNTILFITFADDQLILTCLDFTFPPLSALSTTVAFLVQQIFIQPEIESKIQSEIDKVVGNGRLPTLDDRIEYVRIHIRFAFTNTYAD